MADISLYFHMHQPMRLKPFSIFDIGSGTDYFDIDDKYDFSNGRVMKKITEKSYSPMLSLLYHLLTKQKDFCFALSITGVVIEQMKHYSPEVFDLLKKVVGTGRVEIVSETYYHSLASLYSPTEFLTQVSKHNRLIQDEFGITPNVFRNTELIFTNKVALLVKEMGFKGMLAEGADKVLNGRSPTRLYRSVDGLPLLLKHYKLSDDIAFRFSESHRSNKPLTAETYSHWISSSFCAGDVVNLFMDFETFGEHQWADTGIFSFFEHFVHQFIRTGNRFISLAESIDSRDVEDTFSSEEPVSWADVDRDITAWRGNSLQVDVLKKIYELEKAVFDKGDAALIEDWRRMQTSDHFYYMCTKWANDGDVHAYFSPYGSPFMAYCNYNNALADLRLRTE